ncbi:MAG: NAD(+)/NADH kinase, partial [Chloroflexi bacterium]|nr:NAD(+)/NADH kinase [Chloroflexota bacterium]
DIADLLHRRGIKHWLHTEWDERKVSDDVPNADLVIAIGGDGAMLRAGRVCAAHGVPVLGVNMGWLGFLTEIQQPQDCAGSLDQLLSGDYWIEQRMMLQATLLEDRGRTLGEFHALNDVVISGSVFGRMVQLAAYIDKHWATTYNADALILSTPTGSTAYALATGGPILPPELRNILMLPMAPHLSMDRPIVLARGAVVDVEPTRENRSQVVLTIDGKVVADLQKNQHVRVTSAQPVSQFLRLRERNYFYRSLLDRLEPRINRHGPRRMTFAD